MAAILKGASTARKVAKTIDRAFRECWITSGKGIEPCGSLLRVHLH